MAVENARRTYIPAGIFFDRAINELADFREGFNAWKGVVQFLARQSQDLAVEIDIFAAAEFWIEARAQFQQRGDAPGTENTAAGWLQDAADDLQQRALSGAVRTKKREYFALFDAQVDIAESPELAFILLDSAKAPRTRCEGVVVKMIDLGDILDGDHNRPSLYRERRPPPLGLAELHASSQSA